MILMLELVGSAAGLVILLAWASRALARRYALPTPADEVHGAPTTDGWRLALYRYRPERIVAGREPVLLCHGMLSSRFNMDLDAEVSLARHLRAAGFDAWVMELRGRGGSRREPGPGGRARRWAPFDWSIDEFVREDLPAAIRYVLADTGASSLHWVGHSMGGMLLFAHAARGERSWFRSAVASDSPVFFAPLRTPTWPFRLYARLVPVVPIFLFKPIVTLAYGLLPDALVPRFGFADRATLLRILHNGLIDVGSSRVMLHLARIIAEGRFRSFDRSIDYEEGPGRIDFPLMVIRAPAGRTPEACVRRAYDAAPTRDKVWLRCGKAEGFSEDHNHFTVILGRTAPSEIFPRIEAWLLGHSSA